MFSPFICWFVFFVMSSVIPEAAYAQMKEFDTLYHPDLRQDVFIKNKFRYLNVLKVGTFTVYDIFDCTFECLSNPSCFSVNLAASKGADGKLWCELLSLEMYRNPEEFKENKTSHHFAIKTPCMSSPCQNGGTCLPNYKYHTFDCRCRKGFVGEYCGIVFSTVSTTLSTHSTTSSTASTLSWAGSTASPTALTQPTPSVCAAQWISYGSSCYRLFTSGQKWNKAKVSCENFGAMLVKIESADENEFIKTQFLTGQEAYWIGLSDSAIEGVWKWADGTGLTGYTNWRYDQPNNYGNQDCATIRKYYDAEWQDAKCSNTKGYICEK